MPIRASVLAGGIAALVLSASAQAMPVHIQARPTLVRSVRLSFSAPALPEGGYYYAVVVLSPYKRYTRRSPPPCAVSSDMERADYGQPDAHGAVALNVTRAPSRARRWCAGGSYQGAVYAVPHAPPCEGTYPCGSEPYKEPSPCWTIEGKPVCGVVARPKLWAYPDPLPAPLASGTRIVAHFKVVFPPAHR